MNSFEQDAECERELSLSPFARQAFMALMIVWFACALYMLAFENGGTCETQVSASVCAIQAQDQATY